MAIVDAAGVEPQRFDDYVNILTTAFRNALGADLALDAETEQAELIAVLAEAFAATDAQLVQVANGANISTASGRFLDDLVSFLGVTRQAATRSVITATVSGVVNTDIPAGSQARTAGGDLFATTADITIPAGGSVDATFEAVESGAVPVDANSLTEVVSGVLGWSSVANANAGVIGMAAESDASLRDRYTAILASNNVSTADALRARVLSLDGVTGCLVLENSSSSDVASSANRGIAISAHSIAVIVEGGATQDIVDAIEVAKHIGIATSGTSSGTYTDAQGNTTTINYESVTALPVKIVMSLNTDANRFPGSGVSDIRNNIVALFAGTGDFRLAGPIGIGDGIDANRVTGAITRVPGFAITAGPTITDTSDNALPSPVPYNRRLVIDTAAENFNIEISLT